MARTISVCMRRQWRGVPAVAARVPLADAITRQRFAYRGQIRGPALRPGSRQRTQSLGCHMGHDRSSTPVRHDGLAAKHAEHRRAGALVGNVDRVHLRHLIQQLTTKVRVAEDTADT